MDKTDFICANCKHLVVITGFIGTKNRNHCPSCLYSKHVDQDIPGDRKSACQQLMKPVGLAFKNIGPDKWGQPKQGEIMLIHKCQDCRKISINRIAADDDPKIILALLNKPEDLDQSTQKQLTDQDIKYLTKEDLNQVKTQLFGNS